MKTKLRRFAENKTFSNVIQPTRDEVLNTFDLKGSWNNAFFKNTNPIIVELGCGKGEYTVGLAKQNPDKNYVGIDIKGARFWRGAKTAIEEGLSNVAFVRTQVELVDFLFSENELEEIWITFPDPQIKFRRTKHRLTHPSFLEKYNTVLNKNGTVHLKTDSEFLHGYTHGILQAYNHKVLISSDHIYHPRNTNIPADALEIQTFYEKRFLTENKKITYIKFKLNLS